MTSEQRVAELDDCFVKIYDATRRRLLDEQKDRALILIFEDKMLFYHGGREPQTITGLRPPLYNRLKALSHVPLAIYCLLTGYSDRGEALPQDLLDAFGSYRTQLAATADDVDTTREAETGLLSHRVEIYDRSLAFLDRVLNDGRVTEEDVNAFGRANVVDLNACFFAATKAQLDACHAEMMRLKTNVLSAEEWASLRVVVMGPHMAHKSQNFLQYFSRLLHTPMYTDKRLVFFEGEDIEAALDLVGTAILDLRASQAIFNDENRLHRDVLADATTGYLDALFANPPDGTS